MNDFIFSINAVLPIIILVLIGWFLKRIKLFTPEFLRVANKVTFNVLIPVLLFNNVYAIDGFESINWTFVLYGVLAVTAIFLLAIPICLAFTKDKGQQGVLIQAVFRSNYAIIGIPLATQLFGVKGAAAASILSAFSIPLYNALAVITLSVFSNKQEKIDVKKILLGIVKNPLILGVCAGLVALGIRAIFVQTGVEFRLSDISFLNVSLDYIGRTATPIALLVLGGQFEFSAVKTLAKPIIFGTVLRTAIVPLIALTVAVLLFPNLGGECFASYIALFGTPVAVSSAIMAKEMGADGDLAGQLVVWTTITSSFTLFLTILIFKAIGIF